MNLDPEAGARLKAFMEPRIGAVQPWAERHGIGRDTIYALWRGRQPSPATLKVLAGALGIGYDDLLRIRAGIPPSEGTDLTSVLITEQRETRAMLERVLSSLQAPARDRELESWMARVDERLSLLPTDNDPDTPPGSSPTPLVHPHRRRDDRA